MSENHDHRCFIPEHASTIAMTRWAKCSLSALAVALMSCNNGIAPDTDLSVAVISGLEAPVSSCRLSGKEFYSAKGSVGDIDHYEWTLDDRLVWEKFNYTHSFDGVDPFTLRLKIFDDNNTLLDQTSMVVIPVGPPNASSCVSELSIIGHHARLIRNGEASRVGEYAVDIPLATSPDAIAWSVVHSESREPVITLSDNNRSAAIEFFSEGTYAVIASVHSDGVEGQVSYNVDVVTGEPVAPEGKIALFRIFSGDVSFHLRFMDGETGLVGEPVYTTMGISYEGTCTEDLVVFEMSILPQDGAFNTYDIFSITHNGKDLRHLVQSNGRSEYPDVRGSTVLYVDNGRFNFFSESELAIYDFREGTISYLAGNNITSMPNEYTGRHPALSPNGQIALGGGWYLPDGSETDNARIMLFSSDYIPLGPLITSPLETFGNSNTWEGRTGVSWSDDGQRIAFDILTPSFDNRIYVTSADGSDPRAVANGRGPLHFTPDGNSVLYSVSTDNGIESWIVNIEGPNIGRKTNLSRITIPESDYVADFSAGYCTR